MAGIEVVLIASDASYRRKAPNFRFTKINLITSYTIPNDSSQSIQQG